MSRLLLLSNSKPFGGEFLEHASEEIAAFLGEIRRVIFVPFALADHDGYVELVQASLRDVCVVQGAHTISLDDFKVAKAYFIGGGNTFRFCAP